MCSLTGFVFIISNVSVLFHYYTSVGKRVTCIYSQTNSVVWTWIRSVIPMSDNNLYGLWFCEGCFVFFKQDLIIGFIISVWPRNLFHLILPLFKVSATSSIWMSDYFEIHINKSFRAILTWNKQKTTLVVTYHFVSVSLSEQQ